MPNCNIFDKLFCYSCPRRGKKYSYYLFTCYELFFFERYNVKGDYARIIGDRIIWKGRTFTKM